MARPAYSDGASSRARRSCSWAVSKTATCSSTGRSSSAATASTTSSTLVTPVAIADEKPEAWLEKHLSPRAGSVGKPSRKGRRAGTGATSPGRCRLGYDSWLATPEQVLRLQRAVDAVGGELVAVETNPVDAVWGADRPEPPRGAITLRAARLAGESAAKKIALALGVENYNLLQVRSPYSSFLVCTVDGGVEQRAHRAPGRRPCTLPCYPEAERI